MQRPFIFCEGDKKGRLVMNLPLSESIVCHGAEVRENLSVWPVVFYSLYSFFFSG